jgi:hypothetical protein
MSRAVSCSVLFAAYDVAALLALQCDRFDRLTVP